ncbi:PadR family transcriptional regulator [Ferdinandcohnia quinoae]|uniref:PadR family transcriptional regulator n=1 Tax=Fredinandcohnia quinoae TaxID=2918902 RepID=A0AAW5E3D3_9BACI|nr:PadR family transcriptional regulator [Fredinandcohnia sp. SECRCQ15]MCH1625745.1 PadR family transcriptional regulator [Fredinandcohnia sp. SECRCQ15]
MELKKAIKKYVPMTETAFYILFSLHKPKHGYGIVKHVEEITHSRIVLGSGTVYGTLSKMQKDGLITVYADEERKTVYEITALGKEVLFAEMERVKEVYENILKFGGDFHDEKGV